MQFFIIILYHFCFWKYSLSDYYNTSVTLLHDLTFHAVVGHGMSGSVSKKINKKEDCLFLWFLGLLGKTFGTWFCSESTSETSNIRSKWIWMCQKWTWCFNISSWKSIYYSIICSFSWFSTCLFLIWIRFLWHFLWLSIKVWFSVWWCRY